MRHSCVLVVGLVASFLATALGSYDGGYSSSHDYYEPPAVHPTHHHSHGHSAGSYYHYHVPLVGQQQQHYQPSYHHDPHSHYLWPLLLLLALPLLLLPLLPLLLLPIGISLLALLAPGAMMMMMMMMMMGGEMMMRRGDTVSGRAIGDMTRTFGEALSLDLTSLLSKYARSLDLDQCPQLMACEMGAIIFPDNNSTDASTAKAFSSFIMDQYFPKGTIRKAMKAFWSGSTNLQTCKSFNCQPKFKIYTNGSSPATGQGTSNGSFSPLAMATKFTRLKEQLTSGTTTATKKLPGVGGIQKPAQSYVYPNSFSKVTADNNLNDIVGTLKTTTTTTEASAKPKMKRSHFTPQNHYSSFHTGPGKIHDKIKVSYGDKDRGVYFTNILGTPTIRS